MSPTPPRTFRKALNRQRFLSAAQAVLDKEGLEAISVRRVAAEVGLTPMALYAYFPTKDALLMVLAMGAFVRFKSALEASVEGVATPRERLDRVTAAYLDYALAHSTAYDLMFGSTWSAAPALQEGPPPESGLGMEVFYFFAGIVAENLAEGVPGSAAMPVALQLWATGHGLASLMLRMPRAPFRALDIPSQLPATLLAGLRVQGLLRP